MVRKTSPMLPSKMTSLIGRTYLAMVLPPVSPRPDRLPLNDPSFSWDRFESFCLELISKLPGVKNCHRYGTQGDSQQGIDIFVDLESGERWAFQCKQHEKYTESKAREAIQKATYQANHYILLLSCEATAKVRDVVSKVPSWDVWDIHDISLKVRDLPRETAHRLIETHFGAAWSREFLGVPESAKLISLDKLNNNESFLSREILDAFNKELSVLENNRGQPKGIALAKLARLAVEEEGDFDSALEAFVALLRLAHLVREKGISGYTTEEREDGILTSKLAIQPVNTTLQAANTTNSIIKVLKLFAQTDYGLLIQANERARLYALIGDSPFSQLSNYAQIPHGSFGAISTIWYAVCLDFDDTGMEWAARAMTELMFNTLLGLAFAIDERGIALPEPPQTIYMTICSERWIEPNHHKDLLPLVSLANAIAKLPVELFSCALESLPYFTGIIPPRNTSENGRELADEIEALKRWAVIPNLATAFISLKTQSDVEAFNHELQAVHDRGGQVSVKFVEFLLTERNLALKEKAWVGFEPLQVVNKLLAPYRKPSRHEK